MKFLLFNKIPLFKRDLTNIKIEKDKLRKNWGTFQESLKKMNKKIDLKGLENLKLEIKNFNLKILIGTEDASYTAILVGIASSIFSILLKKLIKGNNNNYWEIMPIYQDKNLLKLNLDCIINFKLIHIIYTIFSLKSEEDKENDRSSNTKYYVYSNE